MSTTTERFELRDYQLEANLAIANSFLQRGLTRQLLVCATGGGKTEIFARTPLEPALLRWLESFPETHRKVLVIAHRDELLTQAKEKIQRVDPELVIDIEKAQHHARPEADVVVASIQTLAAMGGRRIGKFDPEQFRIIVTDEAHHATAPSYIEAFRYFGFLPPEDFLSDQQPEIRDAEAALAWQRRRLAEWDRQNKPNRILLGVTATPNRGDAVGLEAVFQEIVYEKNLRSLIRDGWLCRPRAIKVESATSIDEVHTRAGDFAQNELASAVNKAERTALAVKAYKEHALGRKFVGFGVDVQHAKDGAEAFNANGVRCAVIHGSMDKQERQVIYDEYNDPSSDLMGLMNCMVLTEGWDAPICSCAIMLAPTKSGLKYQQCVGRILRLFPGKEDALIIDVVDVTRRHSLVTSADLFGLPAGFNAKGEDLESLATRVDEIREQHPHINFDSMPDLDAIEMRVQAVDLLALEPSEAVRQLAQLNWVQSSQDNFHLMYPGEDWNEHLELRQNLLGQWDCYLTRGLKNPEKLGRTNPDLESAFKTAERWMFTERHEAYQKARQNAPWRKNPAIQGSIRYAKNLGIDIDFRKVNQGQLSDLINAKLARLEARKRQLESTRLNLARQRMAS